MTVLGTVQGTCFSTVFYRNGAPTAQNAFHLLIWVPVEQYKGSSFTSLKQQCLLSAVVGKAQMLICK